MLYIHKYSQYRLTFAKAMYIGAEIVLALLSVHQLAQPIDIAIALLVAIVGLVREIHLHATLHALGYAIRNNALCKE